MGVILWIQKLTIEANVDDVIKIHPSILARVYDQLVMGMTKLNAARKLKEFSVPFNLAQLVTVLLILHWISTAIVCAILLSNPAVAGLAAFLVCFSFWGVNYVAVELESPFGDNPNDLPLAEMQEDMNRSLVGLLRLHALNTPKFDFMAERDRDLDGSLTTGLTPASVLTGATS